MADIVVLLTTVLGGGLIEKEEATTMPARNGEPATLRLPR